MNWSLLTKQQKQMAVATAVISAAQIFLMAHVLGWTTSEDRGGPEKKELNDLQQKIDSAHATIKNEKRIRDQMDESIERLESLVEYAPASADRYAWAYEFVSRCATQSGVALENLQEIGLVDPAEKNASPRPYEISVSTRAGYSSLIQFLERLETRNPLLEIREVTITAMKDLPLEHQIRVILQWPASVTIERGTP